MGRRAKYLTEQERIDASRARTKSYRKEPLYVPLNQFPEQFTHWCNNRIRFTSNHIAYRKRHSRRCPSLTGYPPELPSLAALPLPEASPLFQQALESADNLDESDFDQWDEDPPYPHQPYVETPAEKRFTSRLLEVMHGRRLRQMVERNMARRQEYLTQSTRAWLKGLRREREDALDAYKRLSAFLPGYHAGPRELAMAEHLLQWRARTVVHLDQFLSI